MRSCRRSYALGALFLLGTNGFALIIPWLLKLAVESLQHPGSTPYSPGHYAAMIAGAAILHGVIRIFSRTSLLHAARRIEYRIREDLYARLLTLDQPFLNRYRTGDIMSRFSNDLTNVRMLVGFGVLNIINTIIIYVAALYLMGRINPYLTVCAIVPYPIMIFIIKRMTNRMFVLAKHSQEELGRITSHVEENVSAAAVVRAYCREDYQAAAFSRISRGYLECNLKMARLRGTMLPVMGGASGMGTLIVLFLGGNMVISGELTLGDFVAFSAYLAMLIWPTVTIGWILSLAQRGAASMERLGTVLDARPTVAEPADPAPLKEIRGDIELKNLHFSYDGEPETILTPTLSHQEKGGEFTPPPLMGGGGGEGDAPSPRQFQLSGINLSIPKGTKLGIVGPVGSGKSTLIRLIARLFPVADGSISIDGTDINRIPLEILRRAIGYIPQESFLFSRSVRENIAFGKESAEPAEIEEAARMASLDGDVQRFPDGYGTLVGERGITLSGGQKQRTAIARALLKNPAILILDDPLSAVDARTEEEILGNLTGYFGDRTVIIVSHRLSALRECDLIIVLEEGRIVEQGTHEALLAMEGRYAAIHWEQQLRREIEGF